MNFPNSAVPRPNWYAVLSLSVTASEDEIAAAVELLGRRAAALAVTAPERSRELRELARSIKQDLLSGSQARQRYDSSLTQPAASTPTATDPVPRPASVRVR